MKNEIIVTVCDYFDVSLGELRSKSRSQQFVMARHFVSYFLRKITKMSFRDISNEMNRSDHSSSFHGNENIKNWILNDTKIKCFHLELTKILKS